MDNSELNIIDEQALGIMEAGAEPEKDLLDEFGRNAELRQQCREIEAMTTAFRRECEKVDVEARLEAFHQRHGQRSVVRTAALIMGIAALFAGVVFLLHSLPSGNPTNPALVYAPESSHGNVVLKREGDKDVVIAPGKTGQLLSFRTTDKSLSTDKAEIVTIEVQEGKSFAVELPDGSRVWLHPGSKIIFPERFVGDLREVKLSGEAYFQVKHDTAHPFIVRAGKIETTVLGTEFDVTSYENQPATVTLVSGSVAVTAGGHQRRICPGTQALLNGDRRIEVKSVNTEKYTNWRDGYFYFDNISLREILTEIGRNYGVCVECNDSALLGQRMHFVAERNQSLQAILTRLKEMAPMQTALNDNVLTVR